MKKWVVLLIVVSMSLMIVAGCEKIIKKKTPLVFATFVEYEQQLPSAALFAESIRTFGGNYKDVPIWIYTTDTVLASGSESLDHLTELNADVKSSQAPEDATWYFLARNVFAAAQAEADAEGVAANLVMLGSDSFIIREPEGYLLPREKTLGYRPVFHKNITPLYREPLGEYWTRAYEVLGVDLATVFPMVTPADGDTIRPYFQAGCLCVKPERGILRNWAETFVTLYQDTEIRKLCEKDIRYRIFTFQAALTGTVLNLLDRKEMIELPEQLNYPIFFKEMFGAKRDFHDITNATTIRYEHFFSVRPPDWKTPENWDQILKGPEDRIAWIKERVKTE